MLDIIMILVLSVVFFGLIAYGISWLQDRKTEDILANKDTYNQFRTNCIQTILRAISTGFCISIKDMTIEQSQTDWNYNWLSIIFDDWIVWVSINWNTKTCKITCMYERDDHEMFVRKFKISLSHNIIDEAAVIQRLERINRKAYKFALPTEKEKATAAIKDAYTLATEDDIEDEQLFDIMYSAWARLPYRTKKEAEDFIRITAFLFRYHFNEMQDKTKIEAEKEDR